jgi:hypothetical protein
MVLRLTVSERPQTAFRHCLAVRLKPDVPRSHKHNEERDTFQAPLDTFQSVHPFATTASEHHDRQVESRHSLLRKFDEHRTGNRLAAIKIALIAEQNSS